jgi:hypothetical protein
MASPILIRGHGVFESGMTLAARFTHDHTLDKGFVCLSRWRMLEGTGPLLQRGTVVGPRPPRLVSD